VLLWIWIERRTRLLQTRRIACLLGLQQQTYRTPWLRRKMKLTDRRTPDRYIDLAVYSASSVHKKDHLLAT